MWSPILADRTPAEDLAFVDALVEVHAREVRAAGRRYLKPSKLAIVIVR